MSVNGPKRTFCDCGPESAFGGKADITQTWRLPAKTPHAMDVGVRRYAAALPAA
jgi:hypothetical protein